MMQSSLKLRWVHLPALAFFINLVAMLPATVGDYAFTGFVRTFTPVTGGTVLFSGTEDEAVSAAQPIGFAFSYDGQTFTELFVSTNGFIKLGGTTAPPATLHEDAFASSAAGTEHLIGPMCFDLVGRTGGSVRVQTQGTSGSRTCTVQWAGWQFKGLGTDPNVAFQVILYESNGAIEFCYLPENTSLTSPALVAVGLKGAVPVDFHLRTTTSNWAATTKAAAVSDTCTFSSTSSPFASQVFRFTKPIAAAIFIGNLSQAEGNLGGTTSFDVQILVSPAPVADLTMDYVIDYITADHGDVTTPDSGTFVFDADGVATSRFFNLAVKADLVGELDETLTITLSNPSLGVLGDDEGLVTIRDDDFSCTATETFGSASGTTPPAGWSVVNHVPTNGSWEFQMPVTYDMPPQTVRSFFDPMALPFAYIDSDVPPPGETLLFSDLLTPTYDCSDSPLVRLRFDHLFRTASGEVRGAVEVSTDGGSQWTPVKVFDDNSEGVFDGLSEPVDLDLSQIAGDKPDVRIRFSYFADFDFYWIVDNVRLCLAPLPPGFTTLVIHDTSVTESTLESRQLVFDVTTAAPVEGEVELEWRFDGGTATPGVDFASPVSGTLTIPKGQGSGQIIVEVPPDATFEMDETVELKVLILSGPALTPDAKGIGTIVNDDTPIIPAVAGNNTDRGWQWMDAANGNADQAFPYDVAANFYNGGDFNGNDVEHLIVWNGRTEFLETINLQEMTTTPGPAITGHPNGYAPIDFSWNPADGKMYVMMLDFGFFETMIIGTVDVQTGVFDFEQIYEAQNTAGGIGIWSTIAHDADGTLYAMGWNNAITGTDISLYRVNLAAISSATLVGPSGIDNDASFFFADFDGRSGILYAAVPDGLSPTLETDLYRVDVTDGSMDLVGTSPGFVRTWAVATQLATTTEGWMLTE